MSGSLISISLLVLIVFSATFSGLTLGLYSLNRTDLERKTELGNKQAARVLHVRKRGNLLLVSLLLGNVAVNSVVAILLGDATSGVIAAIVSTGLIVIFGEIIPQAVCSRFALVIGARTAWVVEATMFILYPVAKPIAWILDKALGEELKTIWSKQELEHIISMHEDHPSAVVDADEERIIFGALRFSEKTAEQIMTPRDAVFSLALGDTVGVRLIYKIREEGYTRIPIFSENEDNIVGIILAKDLLGLEGSRPTQELMRTDKLVRVTPNRKLDEVLNLMMSRHAHMALVTEKSGACIGIVTLEDVLEEIIGREIHDEDDDAPIVS